MIEKEIIIAFAIGTRIQQLTELRMHGTPVPDSEFAQDINNANKHAGIPIQVTAREVGEVARTLAKTGLIQWEPEP